MLKPIEIQENAVIRERERLRKLVEAMIDGYRPMVDNDEDVERNNRIRTHECEWFLSILGESGTKEETKD